jgi:hypothetical protein
MTVDAPTHGPEYEPLARGIHGAVLRPDDDGYDEARSVWNATIDRRPAVVVRSTGAADVVVAVGFARERDLPLAVRGGGHNAAGNAVCDDGLVIDLSSMSSVRVDPAARTARVGPGRRWLTSTTRRRRSGSPRHSASSPRPASPASRSGAASAGSLASTG